VHGAIDEIARRERREGKKREEIGFLPLGWIDDEQIGRVERSDI
jgi:hypothetical protein